jgi:hypothetical protein
MKFMRKWTKEEIEFVKTNYTHMTRQQFANYFKVPLTTIKALTKRYSLLKGIRGKVIHGSSYKINDYGRVFEALAFALQPKVTLEIGVYEGYSAARFKKHSQRTILADMFESFPYKHANETDIRAKFPDCEVMKLDFYKDQDKFRYDSIDLMHIDIANDGNTYRHFAAHYLWKLRAGGIAILEGGSEERDKYWWMTKFNRPKIKDALKEFEAEGIKFTVLTPFPSITIVHR